nr:hypothetical protein [Oceanococcus sp. HetDA_MAG_MS8]
MLRAGLLWLCVGLTLGCASRPPLPEPASCAPLEERGDARLVAGFAGLATQRVWAQLAAHSEGWSRAQWRDLLRRMRDVALHAGGSQFGAASGDACTEQHLQGLWPTGSEEPDAARVQALIRAAQVPSEYSAWQRALGAYPVAAPFLAAGISGYQAEFLDQWAALPEQAWQEYTVSAVRHSAVQAAAALRQLPQDHLGAAQLPASLGQALATAFAPSWVLPAAAEHNRPGRPQAQPLGVDIQQPEVYWRLDYTLLHGRLLPQLSWVLWFSERPAQSAWDPYAGRLDGVIWRTTFGPDGWPVVHDSIHACGCYHLVFPVRHRPHVPRLSAWQEARLQPAPRVDSAKLRLVLRSGDHMLVDVQSRQQPMDATPASLHLKSWNVARAQLQPRMNERGVIAGSERGERWWLWPSGVRNAGAMRDWGRHATAFLGRQHFDDATVLQPYVEPSALWP